VQEAENRAENSVDCGDGGENNNGRMSAVERNGMVRHYFLSRNKC
jgi:hypothetical protein